VPSNAVEPRIVKSKPTNSACISISFAPCSVRSAYSIRKNELVAWLVEQAEEREWAASTRNCWEGTGSLIFRVGLDNKKVERNPADE